MLVANLGFTDSRDLTPPVSHMTHSTLRTICILTYLFCLTPQPCGSQLGEFVLPRKNSQYYDVLMAQLPACLPALICHNAEWGKGRFSLQHCRYGAMGRTEKLSELQNTHRPPQ